MKLKSFLYATMAFIAAALPASAQFGGWQANDVVLVLWANNYDTIDYDLGNVSQFLNKTNGYVAQVTGWNASAAVNYFGPWPAQGGFVPLNFNAGTASSTTHIPYVTDTVAQNISSTLALNVVGNDLANYGTSILGAGSTNYSVYAPDNKEAYDNNASFESDWGITSLSGSGKVYSGIPGAITFWALGVNSATNLGSFQFTADGRLFFEVPPILNKTTIANFTYDGLSEADVTFKTVIGGRYQLLKSTSLALPLRSWTAVTAGAVDYLNGGAGTGTVFGDGNLHTLSDLNATNAPAFYSIESY